MCSILTLILLARILLLFVYNANSMLGNTIGSFSVAMVTFVGHSVLNSAHSLHVHSITFLVDSHVSGQRNNSMFLKGLENIAGVSLFPFVLVILVNY